MCVWQRVGGTPLCWSRQTIVRKTKKKTPFLKHQRRKLAEKSCVQGESGCRTLALVQAVEEDDAINGRNV